MKIYNSENYEKLFFLLKKTIYKSTLVTIQVIAMKKISNNKIDNLAYFGALYIV